MTEAERLPGPVCKTGLTAGTDGLMKFRGALRFDRHSADGRTPARSTGTHEKLADIRSSPVDRDNGAICRSDNCRRRPRFRRASGARGAVRKTVMFRRLRSPGSAPLAGPAVVAARRMEAEGAPAAALIEINVRWTDSDVMASLGVSSARLWRPLALLRRAISRIAKR